MAKILRFLLHRVVITAVLLLIQLAALIAIIWRFTNYFALFYVINVALSLFIMLFIINDDNMKSGFKLAWVVPILLLPLFGAMLYYVFGRRRRWRGPIYEIHQREREMSRAIPPNGVPDEIMGKSRTAANQSHYISENAHYPPYKRTYTEYLPLGESKFKRLKEELRRAERYIFLEYFIVQEGIMWDEILGILTDKAARGVDVRIVYDDLGCGFTLPYGYEKKLRSLGIECRIFNPFTPVLSSEFNNRDHRKLVVIDGHTAFTGGINLADEYINAYEKHGHWKDTAIMVKGEAVFSFVMMFLSVWSALSDTAEDIEDYRPDPGKLEGLGGTGYVQPYGDTPIDRELVSETIYLNLISKAERYVYINTPYLIIDAEMVTALCAAAKSGVDVRIVTPHKPDKWYVHAVTKSYYETLLRAGVKIYEYTPGFMHAKSFVADGLFGVIGTVNLDYRSLYLHLECGVWMYETDSIRDMYEDYVETLKLCRQVLLEDVRAIAWYRKLARMILRSFAPLM